MKNLTIVVTVHNDIENLEACLNSCNNIECDILVGITSNNSKAFDIADNFTKSISYIGFDNDFSSSKNDLLKIVKSNWVLFLESHEIIVRGHEEISDICKGEGCYRINLIQDQIITKPIRLWSINKNLYFKNPIYENVKYDASFSNIYIKSSPYNDLELNLKILQKWQERLPLALEPIYYKSCIFLSQNKWDDYINTANHFLFKETNHSISHVMTKYYLGIVYCYIKKDYQNAIKCALECLIKKPLMAEFWCLLGDIYYSLDRYEKAYHFYENAKILGSRRLKNDEWPFQLDKYKATPEKMMLSCQQMINDSKNYMINK
jgi:tetratricopeptide (TPR) repeat protein